LIRFNYEQILAFEDLASVGHSYSFVTAVATLTLAQIDLLALQDTFGRVMERLAARRLLEFGDDGARSTVCGRPCPSALDGLLDVHKRVNVLVYPLGQPLISAVASAIPDVMSRTPHLVPYYAGRADNEIVPDDGLDPRSVHTLADDPGFREAVTQAYRTSNAPRICGEIQAFGGRVVLSTIKAELSMLREEKGTPHAAIPSPLSTDSVRHLSPASSLSNEEARLSPCYAKALCGYREAGRVLGDAVTDRGAYEWLKERDDDGSLPRFDSWARYLREARSMLGIRKPSSRHGLTGRSVVRRDEL
jgi:hypothetical protein